MNESTTKRIYLPLNGPEVVELVVKEIMEHLKTTLPEELKRDTRLSSEVHAFPHAEITFNYNFDLLMAPKGEGRCVKVTGTIKIPDIEPIPPDAVRILNDMPVMVEEIPTNAPFQGKVDVAKMASEIDPKLKELTIKKFVEGVKK